MRKIKNIRQQTQNKFLNLFVATYDTPNGDFDYQIASRKRADQMVVLNPDCSADAVRVLPYLYKDGEMHVVITHEFRYPVNRVLYGLPAGLIDDGEDAQVSARREVEEEIGATVIKLEQTEAPAFTSAGMSDESIVCFEAEVVLDKQQRLSDSEIINFELIKLTSIPDYLNRYEFGLQSCLQLRSFYYKQMYLQLLNKK